MEINLTTPALLFPAVSLIMLGYSTRFLALAQLIRQLHATYRAEPSQSLAAQIANLRHRVRLTRNMQALGALTILLAAICMLLLFAGWEQVGKAFFGVSLFTLIASLILSLREIQLSIDALNVQLGDMEFGKQK